MSRLHYARKALQKALQDLGGARQIGATDAGATPADITKVARS